MKVKYKTIAGSKINPIGIGTWGVGGFMEPEYGKEEDQIKAIRYSIKQGQNHIDTAEMYGNGHSEEIVGEAILGLDRDKLFIASKIHRNYTKADEVESATEEILKRLQIDKLDMLYLHSYWEDEDMDKYLKGLNSAKENNLTDSIAVSNWNLDNLKWGVSNSTNPIVANQMNYNILHQEEVSEEMQSFCEKENIMIVAYRPIERKLLADECENEVVLQIAKKYNKIPSQIALNWLIIQKNVLAIPKSTNKEHIDENLKALEFELDDEDIKSLNKLG